jgi:hypothetical protein
VSSGFKGPSKPRGKLQLRAPPLGIAQEVLQLLCELIAAREMTPVLGHSLMVYTYGFVSCFGRTPFSIGRSR